MNENRLISYVTFPICHDWLVLMNPVVGHTSNIAPAVSVSMGCTQTMIIAEGAADFDALQAKQKVFEKRMTVPLSIQVAHFTPASFPLLPVINKQVNKLCTASWNSLVEQEFEGEGGTMISGITVLYHEFYKRLSIFDSKGMFEAVLTRHSGSQNKVAVKGSILVRIIKFVLAVQEDNEETQLLLFVLGKSHQQKQIRPWQYSVFIETLLNVLASQLGVGATADVMYAWVNLFAYVLKSMLPPAIEGLTLSNELNVNTSSVFDTMKAPTTLTVHSNIHEDKSRPHQSRTTITTAAIDVGKMKTTVGEASSVRIYSDAGEQKLSHA